jgi:hypothetical protein
LIFAMSGLEIEAAEAHSFPQNLSITEVKHALRYITWELNGFPGWLEKVFNTNPKLVIEAVEKELIWELNYLKPDQSSLNYIMNDIIYYALWLYKSLTPILLEWLDSSDVNIRGYRDNILQILIDGEVKIEKVIDVALAQIHISSKFEDIAYWYAILVDIDPDNSILKLESWLKSLDENEAEKSAQLFLNILIAHRQPGRERPVVGNFKEVKYLKRIYLLMIQYIEENEDVDFSGKGAFSPTLRYNAQNDRERLIEILINIPGKESFDALKEITEVHPIPSTSTRLKRRLREKVESDGDLELWSEEQIRKFNENQLYIPKSNRQLYDVTVHRLNDLKNWLENGNDSPWKTWQRATSEEELRTLIAGWLNQQSQDKYTTAMESEIANNQRMDIWVHNTHVNSPVPIELKLLDKKWSGPKLCERLRNQLVGDYLREKGAKYGVLLLVAQKIDAQRKWIINGKRVNKHDLSKSLINYWNEISGDHPNAEGIDVIFIDLDKREYTSKT